MGDRHRQVRGTAVAPVRSISLAAAFFLAAMCVPAQARDYCVTIKSDARPGERVSTIDLVLKNATLVSIPRYPPGWQIEIRQEVEGDTFIFGGALAGVAEIEPGELKCLFRVQRSFDDKSVRMAGSGSIGFGIEPERRVRLQNSQVLFSTTDTR